MSSYIKFLELLAQSQDINGSFKKMLKDKDLKKAGEQVRGYFKKYGKMCCNPIYAHSRFYDKTGAQVQFISYYVFPFVTSGPLKNVDNLIKLYKFFFVPEKVVISTKYAYEE